MTRALSFGQVADDYDRYRPGYPDALYAAVLAPRVLEAGAGTGRATLAMAQRGANVVAVEPDPAMAAVVRRRTQQLSNVAVHESAFEDFVPEPGVFDRVVSAQAWHWVDPERGARTAAAALKPDGRICLWWNHTRDISGPTWDAVHAAYREHAPELIDNEDDTLPDALPGFTPWTVHEFPWDTSYDADGYAGLMLTHSNHIALEPGRRARLGDAIRAAIGDGRLEYPYRTLLITAQPIR